MKILVIQLARLGDIFQTWPALNAIKRMNPGSELHFLTRAAFSSATETFQSRSNAVDRFWTLETKSIIAPLVDERPNIDASLTQLSSIVDALKAEQFDLVVNLSFSGFSASLVNEIAPSTAVIRGYSRFDDGTLSIPDDSSAYFFGQVGPGLGNRIHITDLFASVAGVELDQQDWSIQDSAATSACPVVQEAGRDAIVVHVGASTLSKTLGWAKWHQVVSGLLAKTQYNVILVGSPEEAEIAAKVAETSSDRKPLNLVGRTKISELFEIVKAAKLVIGGDSAPVQIASITNTPVLNLSFPMVSAWETGPRSAGSRILRLESEDTFTADEIAREAIALMTGRSPFQRVIKVPERNMPFIESQTSSSSNNQAYEWKLQQAVYMGADFPVAKSETFVLGLQRLSEINSLAIEQLAVLAKRTSDQTAGSILDRVDEMMDAVVKFVPEAGVLVRWFRVERMRLGPMPIETLIHKTQFLHERLSDVLSLYVISGEAHGDVGLDQI